MAGSVNKVLLIGNVTRVPEIKQFSNGNRIANFSLATSETWRDKQSGERKEKAEFHNISVTGEGLVKVIENYVKKGSKLYIEGSLSTRKWKDKDGNERYTTEISVGGFGGSITLLDSKGSYQSKLEDDSFDGDYEAPSKRSSGSQSYSSDIDDGDFIPF